jgi:hypothetical protein
MKTDPLNGRPTAMAKTTSAKKPPRRMRGMMAFAAVSPVTINPAKTIITVTGTVTNSGNTVVCVLIPMMGIAIPAASVQVVAVGNSWTAGFICPVPPTNFPNGPYLVQATAAAEGSSSTIFIVT